MRAAECRCIGGLSGCGLKREAPVRAAAGLRKVPIVGCYMWGDVAGRGLAVPLPKNRGKNDG